MSRPESGKKIALFLLSASLLSFQLSLIQIFSIVQWYHFAYMVLSMALLGFGASGTFLAFFRKYIIPREQTALFILINLTALSMPVSVWITQTGIGTFDSYLVFIERSEAFKLIATYFILFIPFFLGAVVIGYLLTTTKQVGRLYFANLIGSGAGSLLALGGMHLLAPSRLAPFFALLSFGASLFFLQRQKKSNCLLAGGSFLFCLLMVIAPPQLYLSQYKSLSYALNVPDAEIILEHTSPRGHLQIVSSRHLRHSPGLSLTHFETLPSYDVMYLNGNWLGPIYTLKEKDPDHWLMNSLFQLPFHIKARNKALILEAGTGKDVLLSLLNNVKEITAVEGMQSAHRLLDEYAQKKEPHVFQESQVKKHYLKPRSFLMQHTDNYDLITVPTQDAFGGTGGLYAVQEQYLFTVESFAEKWNLLTDDGVIMLSSWIDYPFRSPLKLLATAVEMLDKKEIQEHENHIAAIKNWGTMLILVKKQPFTPEESALIIEFCRDRQFDPLLIPHKDTEAIPRYHPHQDELFYEYIPLLLTPQRYQFYREYDFHIQPARDNKPYFSQFLRFGAIGHLRDIFGERALPFFELGLLLVLATFIQIFIAAVIFIVLPLIPLGFKGKNKPWTLLYFSGIGTGFMFVEIAFIQNFILYLGHPIYSASIVIGVMLVSSGIGSFFSGRFSSTRRLLKTIPCIIALIILVYSFSLPAVLEHTIFLNAFIRFIIAALFISILSLIMGFAFPLGLSYLSGKDDSLTPWAWGINGCFSVISTAGATLIAIQFGFQMIFTAAALAYLLCSAAGLLLRDDI